MRLLLCALVLWGCAGDETQYPAPRDGGRPPDGGRADGARPADGAVADRGLADTSPADGRPTDRGPGDGGPGDGGLVDRGPGDGGLVDRGPGDGGPGDGGPGDGAAADARADAGPPLVGPPGQWVFLPIEGMRCADGLGTGIGVNFAPGGSRRVLVYLFGGGACWDEASCYQDGRAAFIDPGFRAADFPGEQLNQFWFFNRNAPENLFADHHLVLVPYCTGDIHGGDRVAVYGGRPTHHVGAVNFTRVAERLAATWPDLERVVLAGGSAGGFGAMLNWHRARAHFPGARVDLINDGGVPIPPPQFPAARRAQWNQAWGFANTLPADCPECLADWSRLVPHGLAQAPGARAALLTSLRDGVIADYLGVSPNSMEAGVAALVEDPPAGYGAFLVPGDAHVLMAAPVIAGGQTVPQWLAAMQADAPGWGTVGPDPLPPCATLPSCNECALCAAQGPCAAEYARCNDIAHCVEAVVCALGCAPADQACIVGCAAPFPAVAEAGLALYQCVRCGVCGEDCGACP